jgi:hypothetical protein
MTGMSHWHPAVIIFFKKVNGKHNQSHSEQLSEGPPNVQGISGNLTPLQRLVYDFIKPVTINSENSWVIWKIPCKLKSGT